MMFKLVFALQAGISGIDLSRALSYKLGERVLQGANFKVVGMQYVAEADQTGVVVGHVPTTDKLVDAWRMGLNCHKNDAKYRGIGHEPGEFNVGWSTVSMYEQTVNNHSYPTAADWARLDGSANHPCQPVSALDFTGAMVSSADGIEYDAVFALMGPSQKNSDNSDVPATDVTVGLFDMYNELNPTQTNESKDPWGTDYEEYNKHFAQIHHACESTSLVNVLSSAVTVTSPGINAPGSLQFAPLNVMCGLLRISQSGGPTWLSSPDRFDFADGDRYTDVEAGYLTVWVSGWDEF